MSKILTPDQVEGIRRQAGRTLLYGVHKGQTLHDTWKLSDLNSEITDLIASHRLLQAALKKACERLHSSADICPCEAEIFDYCDKVEVDDCKNNGIECWEKYFTEEK